MSKKQMVKTQSSNKNEKLINYLLRLIKSEPSHHELPRKKMKTDKVLVADWSWNTLEYNDLSLILSH